MPISKADATTRKLSSGFHVKSDGPAGRVRRWRLTDSTIVDRDGDVVLADGIDFQTYLTNPTVLFSHAFHSPPIGRAVKVWLSPDKTALFADVVFAETELAEDLLKLVDLGALNAASIGFRVKQAFPPDWSMRSSIADGANKCLRVIASSELLEISLVTIPSNPRALHVALGRKGFIKSHDLRKSLMSTADSGVIFKAEPGPVSTAEGQEISEDKKCARCGRTREFCKCEKGFEAKPLSGADKRQDTPGSNAEKCEVCGKLKNGDCQCQVAQKALAKAIAETIRDAYVKACVEQAAASIKTFVACQQVKAQSLDRGGRLSTTLEGQSQRLPRSGR
jgi:HK97 family phage prohead protease